MDSDLIVSFVDIPTQYLRFNKDNPLETIEKLNFWVETDYLNVSFWWGFEVNDLTIKFLNTIKDYLTKLELDKFRITFKATRWKAENYEAIETYILAKISKDINVFIE